jgi:hypothetical protein
MAYFKMLDTQRLRLAHPARGFNPLLTVSGVNLYETRYSLFWQFQDLMKQQLPAPCKGINPLLKSYLNQP